MQTPQQNAEGRITTSLLFTPRTVDSRSSSEYRPRGSAAATTRSPSPTPELGRQHREGSFFRESSVAGSLAGGSTCAGGGRPQREGSAVPETPTARNVFRSGERSRLSHQSLPQDGRERVASVRGTSPTGGAGGGTRSRRRSTTPVWQSPQDAPPPPPPPPTSSLFDNSAVGSAWATPTAVKPPAANGEDGQVAEPAHPEAPSANNTDCWVIAYGFRSGDAEKLLTELGKAGDILQHGTFGAPATCNWLYLQFQDKWAAQRALYRDGEQLTRTTMIGVRPLDAVHMAAVREHLQADGPPHENLAPTPAMQRRYLIDAGAAPVSSGSVPAPTQSMWAKVNDFVFGI